LSVEGVPGDAAAGAMHSTSARPALVGAPWIDESLACSSKCGQILAEGVALGAEDADDVFPEQDGAGVVVKVSGMVAGALDVDGGEGEVAARVVEAGALADGAEGLAGGPGAEQGGGVDVAELDARGEGAHVDPV